jgi:MFS family permease
VAAGFGAFLNLYPPQALLPELEIAFGTGPGGAAATVAAGTLAVAVAGPFAGLVADLLGRRAVIAAATAALAAATMLTGTADTLGEMLVWRLISGCFVPGILASAVGALGDETEPGEAARIAGYYISGTLLGGFSGRFLAGVLAEYFGWRAAFFALGALTLVLVPLLLAGIPRSATTKAEHRSVALRGALAHLRNARLLATFAIGFGMLFAVMVTFTYAPLHLAAPPYRLSSAQLGSVFAVYLVGIVVTPLTGSLIARFGRRRLSTAAAILAMVGIATTLVGSVPIIVAGLAISSSGLFLIQSLATGFIPAAAAEAKSTAAGLYSSFYYLGGTLGAVVPALIWKPFGWPGCVALLVATHVTLVLICRTLWR